MIGAHIWIYCFTDNSIHTRKGTDVNDTISSFIEERDKKGLDYFIPEKEEVLIHSLPEVFKHGYIGLSIGAQHETKKLRPDLLVKLCQKLEYPILVMGGPEDRHTGEIIASSLPEKDIVNGCGSYSIHQSASLVKQARLLITHDTGLMHIASAFRKKIISIWGNTIPEFGMYPYLADPDSVVVQVNHLSCRPCSKIGYTKCPKKHFKCIEDIDVEQIAEIVSQLLSK